VICPCGPWREVRLEIYERRISDLWVNYVVSEDLKMIRGTLRSASEGSVSQDIAFSISRGDKTIFSATTQPDENGFASVDFEIHNPLLWYPYKYGPQDTYEVHAACGSSVCSKTKTVGFRKVRLVQEVDRVGKTFYFNINNCDIFCGGSNWIPADSFTPRLTPERYRTWLQMMVDGHQSMIRIWGGGIYEEDVFYDLCDELGILVWQDFMFGCGNYPAFPELRESIRMEAQQNVRRIRHHPSLVIFAGNNEDYQVQETNNLTYEFHDKNPENWLKTNFPARFIYEKILPEVMEAEAPHIPYHPGSPWGDGLTTSNATVGDMHQWNGGVFHNLITRD